MGCSLSIGVRLIGLISILLAACVVASSAWLLKTTYEKRESTVGQVVRGIGEAGSTFGFTTDPDKLDRIKIWVTAVSVSAGALQLITSIFLLFCSSSKGGRTSAKLWLFINFFVILATAGSFICLMSMSEVRAEVQNQDKEHQVKLFLGSTGLDALLLFLFSFVTGSWGCRGGRGD